MSALAARLRDKHYRNDQHPYRIFERRVDEALSQGVEVLLDAGCGRTAPVLRKYLGKVKRLIGVELVSFRDVPPGIETYEADLGAIPIADACVDLIISRSVFEHLVDPESVYREFSRVLRPGGKVIFLTANMWDYGTLAARLLPNRLHGRAVKVLEGREEEDTFPTAYRTNTRTAVDRLAASVGFQVRSFEYLSQYPNYFLFNGVVFFIGMCFEKLISRFHMLRILRGWIMVTLVKS